MPNPILGLHHVTAIIGEPQPNIDFYTDVLGLRMVKLTVNYDDPGTYHLYFGDRTGKPGTAITFFPWPRAFKGRPGYGQIIATAYAIPIDSLDYWQKRLESRGIEVARATRFEEHCLSFDDPDMLRIDLIATNALPDVQPWERTEVPEQHAIHGFHSVTLAVRHHEPSEKFLTEVFGFERTGIEDERRRFQTGAGLAGTFVDLLISNEFEAGDMGPGTVHHVAWRVADDETELAWREALIESGRRVTPVKDRNYFHSIYFREPGGVIFEIATDGPGMTVDEPVESLGTQLQLPPFARNMRSEILANLPKLELPTRS